MTSIADHGEMPERITDFELECPCVGCAEKREIVDDLLFGPDVVARRVERRPADRARARRGRGGAGAPRRGLLRCRPSPPANAGGRAAMAGAIAGGAEA